MSLSFCVLGSGSLGNSTVVLLESGNERRCLLLDCGLSPRATRQRLGDIGLILDDVTDILLTHLDADHFAPGWVKVIPRQGITLHLHRRHRARALRAGIEGRHLQLFDAPHHLDKQTHLDPVMLAHDDLGTVGYVLEHAGTRFALATDLGRVPNTLLDRFVDLHGLAIESNYDRDLQLASDRPPILKRRIMNGRGHLSNEEALEAVLTIEQRSHLSHVALLHVSRQCNEPGIIQRLYARRAPHLLDRLTITSQHRPTMLHRLAGAGAPLPGEQLAMF